ncbi:hypothetical protein M406DRAFT_73785 [Cryphonectria parasitica EP155]|uniref:Uncharacterized protein n=1 Tax=Cryphonectria parasitica (strain ATCC 38755 / EP155) TaxID=660469 RepID=A0A9P4XYA9_CRYP1|nr:uncharacterized protein M406DRAFT_73785 [Cryphonectria parasitica EP155]KAF3763156.1 hypothetical protein M406DRAFT_73785 [Cryphonectria parasitica EP155]
MAGLGSSRDEAISISSAESSVCGDLDENLSDIFLPPVKELGSPAKAKKAGSRSVVVGMPIGAASAPARDSNTTWSGCIANSRTEKSLGLEGLQPPRALSPLTPLSPVLPTSMQAEGGLYLADNTFNPAIQGCDDHDLHDLTSADNKTPLLPSPSRHLAHLERRMIAEVQASMPPSLPPSGGDSDDRACPALARLETAEGVRTPGAPDTPAPALYSPRAIAEIEGQASHYPRDQSSSRPLSGFQNHDAIAIESGKGEEGEEDSYPLSKRRKEPASSQSTNPRAAIQQLLTSGTGVSRSQKARRLAATVGCQKSDSKTLTNYLTSRNLL